MLSLSLELSKSFPPKNVVSILPPGNIKKELADKAIQIILYILWAEVSTRQLSWNVDQNLCKPQHSYVTTSMQLLFFLANLARMIALLKFRLLSCIE